MSCSHLTVRLSALLASLLLVAEPQRSSAFTVFPSSALLSKQQNGCLHRSMSSLQTRYMSDIPNIPFEDDDFGANDNGDENDSDVERLTDEELEATLEDWDDTIPRFNTIHLTGRIGNDPDPRYFDDGKVVVNLSLASQRKYNNMERMVESIKSGEEETDWYGLEIWGQTAEFVSKYVDKGMRVGVIGTLQIDQWMDKVTNEPRSKAKVIVRDFDILETRAESEARRARSGGSRGPAMYSSSSDGGRGFSSGGTYNDDYDDGPSAAGTGGFFDS
jgi:single-strand DNA-binding protein